MAGHYAALPSLEVLEGMVNNRAPARATPSQARSPTVSKWAHPVAEGITIIDDILSLLRGTGLEAEILELVTTASDVHRVLQQVQGMLAAGQAMPEGYEFQVLHFATGAAQELRTKLRAWEEVGVLVTKLQEPRTRLPLDPINARLNAFGAQLRAVFRLKQSEFTPESVIPEGDALRFWLTNFGSQHMVEWSKFEDALASDLGRPLHDAEQRHLREALDASDSGHISAHKFGAFLQGFGPGVRDSVEQLSDALDHTWFHGFMSYNESVNLLRGARPGTFLIRFSQSSPCALALVVVLGADEVQQFLIEARAAGGFKLGTMEMRSLPELVSQNRSWLKYPAPNELSSCRYFHGFLTFPETTDLLDGKPEGTYLLRFSHSQPGSLVVALMNSSGVVQQSLVHSNPERGGYTVGKEMYRTLDELIRSNADKLKHPLFAAMYAPRAEPPAGLGLKATAGQTSLTAASSGRRDASSGMGVGSGAGAGAGSGSGAGTIGVQPSCRTSAGASHAVVTVESSATAPRSHVPVTGGGGPHHDKQGASLLPIPVDGGNVGGMVVAGGGASGGLLPTQWPVTHASGGAASSGGFSAPVAVVSQIGDEYGPMPGTGPMLVAGFSQSSAGSFDSDAFPTVPMEKTGNPGAPEPLHDTGGGPPPAAGGGGSAGRIPHLHPHHLANFPQHRGSRESFQGVLPNGASPHGNGPSSDSSAAAVAAAAAGVQGVPATTTGLRTAPSFGDYRPPSSAVHPVASLQPRVVRAGVPGYDADAMGYPPMPGRLVGGDNAGGYPPMAMSDGAGFAVGTLGGHGDLLSSDSGADYAAMPGATAGMHAGASASGIPPSPGQGVAFGWGGPVASAGASAGDMAARAVARVHAAQAGGAGAAATAAPTPARRSQSHAVASVPPPPEFGRAATSSFVSASSDGLALTERERYEAQIRALQEQLQAQRLASNPDYPTIAASGRRH